MMIDEQWGELKKNIPEITIFMGGTNHPQMVLLSLSLPH